MSVVVVTGSAGLVGSECVDYFCELGFVVVGIDNDMRQSFFGVEASTRWNLERLQQSFPKQYMHYDVDIRNQTEVEKIFNYYSNNIVLVIHAAAQPSHDWATREPWIDFTVNANGTLIMLEATRKFSSEAVFIFTSTNKVYGVTPNNLPLMELETRWELPNNHPNYNGVDESMSIDQTKHSLFGASKVAADILVQEYGLYFDMKTVCFRGGCLTGPNHSGTELHGFLAYLMKCVCTGKPYVIYGYKGKQVRDNIHSADLVSAFYHYYQEPRIGEVYNIGGSRHSNCSLLEAIDLCQIIANKELDCTYIERNRLGDHLWYISDVSKFKRHFPDWQLKYDVNSLLEDIYYKNIDRWSSE